LRRAGLFVRTDAFLDRAAHVRTVVFDKTGTLTSGALRVRRPEILRALPEDARNALRDLAAATWHPKSAAVLRALDPAPRGFGLVVEHPSRGVSLHRDGREWRLGAPEWVSRSSASGDLALGVDGRLVCTIATEEELRPDAAREV